tara:strand:+ start:2806 stop:2976 length:171 start_codon:yes stop_codon:yes gene_type:complete
MNGVDLQLIMLDKGITLDRLCDDLDLSRNQIVGMLHGDSEISKEVKVYVGTYAKGS